MHASRVGGGISTQERQDIHNHLRNNLTKIKPSTYSVCPYCFTVLSPALPPFASVSCSCLQQASSCLLQVTRSAKTLPDVWVRDPMKSLILTVRFCQNPERLSWPKARASWHDERGLMRCRSREMSA